MFNKGLVLKKLKKYDEALDFINRSIEIEPNRSDNAWILKGNILRELGDDEGAIKCYNSALNKNPHNSLARQNKITSLKNLGRTDDIKKTLEEGEVLNKDDDQSLFLTGFSKFKLGLYKEAIDYFDKTLKLNPSDPSAKQYKNLALSKLSELERIAASKPDSNDFNALSKKGASLIKLDKTKEGLNYLTKAAEINTNSADIRASIGATFFNMKDFNRAIKWYDDALRLDPNFTRAKKERIMALQKLGTEKKSTIEKPYTKISPPEISPEIHVSKKNKKRATKLYKQGLNYFKQKQYNQALKFINNGLNLFPNFPVALCDKGAILGLLKRYKEAFECFDEALRYNPDLEIAKSNKKWLSDKLGLKKETTKKLIPKIEKKKDFESDKIEGVENAIQLFKELKEIISKIEDEKAKVKLTELFEEKFRSSSKYRQVEFLEELEKKCPNNKYVWSLLENKHLEIKNLGQAVICAKNIVKIDQNDDAALNRLGWMLTIAAKFEEAKKNLDTVLVINPKNTGVLKNLSLLYEAIGEKEKAIEYLQHYLQSNSEDKEAKGRLEKLINNQSEILGIRKKIRETLGWQYNIDYSTIETYDQGMRSIKMIPIRDEDDYADIDIEGKALTEFRKVNIPMEEVKFLQKIENLTGVDFMSSETSYIGQKLSFSTFKNRVIELSINKVKLNSIPKNISDLEAIRKIHISKTNIETLPDSIGDLKYLEGLHVTFNENLTSIPSSIGKLKNLEKLYIGHNQLTELPESIGDLDSLKIFQITLNKIKKLPKTIGNLKSIKSVDFQGNQLEKLPESIGNLNTLKSLTLFNNKLTSLPESIGNLKLLKNIWVDKNSLTNLPESIGNLKKLEWIKLNENPIRTLPWSLLDLPSLKKVDFFKNPLYDQLDFESKKIVEQLHQNGVVLDNP